MKNTNHGIQRWRLRVNNGVLRMLTQMAFGILLGLLMPQASVYDGMEPFGVALAAAVSGPSTALVFACALIGYLLQGMTTSLRYMAALVVVAGIRWSISGFRHISRSLLFAAAVAFVSILVTGSALVMSSRPTFSDVLIILCESVLAAGFAYFTAYFFREIEQLGDEPLSEQGQISAVILISVSMIALLAIEFSGISPGRILCGIMILLASRLSSRISGGMMVGILMGLAVLLATPSMAYLSPAFAVAGLLSTVFSQRGKWLSALLYVICVGLTTVLSVNEITVVIGLYEAVAAGLLFIVVPVSVETSIERVFLRVIRLPEEYASRQAVASGIHYAAKSMSEVVEVVDTVSRQLSTLGSSEIVGVCQCAIDEVCNTCKHRVLCAGSHYAEIADSLNHAIQSLKINGSITEDEFSGYLDKHCRHREKVADRLTAGYREFLMRESAAQRLADLRAVVNDQFSSMATFLEEFSERISKPEWVDLETQKRIRKMLQKEEIAIQSLSCRVSDRGRMTVEILLDGKCQPQDKQVFRRKISEQCGRPFSSPLTEYASGVTRITFTEQSTYRVSVGIAQLACDGMCGDSYEVFRDSEGSQLLVLSDGMGSGGRAAVDSAMTAGMAVRLLRAGFGYDSMLKMINTALITKSDDESLATLDLVDINVYTGDVQLLKAGAGQSLLYSKGRVARIGESSLPLGILRELSFEKTEDRLVDGDMLITMSDGVSNEGLEWVESIIKTHVSLNGTRLSDLANEIAEQARMRQRDNVDDITVLVAQLHKIA